MDCADTLYPHYIPYHWTTRYFFTNNVSLNVTTQCVHYPYMQVVADYRLNFGADNVVLLTSCTMQDHPHYVLHGITKTTE